MIARIVSGTMAVAMTMGVVVGLSVGAATAWAQDGGMGAMPHPPGGHQQGMEHHPGMDHAAHHAMMHGGGDGAAGQVAAPKEAGQDAFGTIQEIIAILDADPTTDWSKVDIEALRTHLVDMNRVTVDAEVAATEVPRGAQFVARGTGRTLEALRRMVPAHAAFIDGRDGWKLVAQPREYGVTLTVTAGDPAQTTRIRALGFIGVMATGAHHQAHHLAIAKGLSPHAH